MLSLMINAVMKVATFQNGLCRKKIAMITTFIHVANAFYCFHLLLSLKHQINQNNKYSN